MPEWVSGRQELNLEELSAENIDLVRDRVAAAANFEEQIEVESYLDTLWSMADSACHAASGRAVQGRVSRKTLEDVRGFLQEAHDSAAVDQTERALAALGRASDCLRK
jgi:hypothetical protein